MANPDSPDALAPGLIHEMRHPLMAIKAGLKMLEGLAGRAVTGSEEWELVTSQLSRLEELFRRYQEFLSPDQTPVGPFPVVETVESALKLLAWRTRKLGGRFTVEAPKQPLLAHGTPAILTHAIVNVVANALDSLEKAGGEKRLALRVLSVDDEVQLRVSDEGGGITEDDAARLFQPGFTTKPGGNGSGLGLKLAKRLLERCGGVIGVAPKNDPRRLPWAAAELVVTLDAVSPSKGAPSSEASAATPAPAPAAQKLRALIVDDEEVILKLLAKALGAAGYEVTTAATGDEALQKLQAADFDVLLTDKNLPGPSGVELARTARKKSATMSIVMITGYASRDSARALMKLGVDGYIEKPFELEHLVERLAAIRKRRLEPAPLEPASAAGVSSGRTVLVVEPDNATYEAIASGLQRLGGQAARSPDVLSGFYLHPRAAALLVATVALDTPARQAIWLQRQQRPSFVVLAVCEQDTLSESITAVSIGARGQVFRPVTADEVERELVQAVAMTKAPA